MPGVQYTPQELRDMTREDFEAAERRGFVKPGAGIQINLRAPDPATSADKSPYAPTAWGAKEFDFVVPSGQRCRLRRLEVEKLLEEGILDRVSRLPGLAAELVEKAEGAPPSPAMPDREQIRAVIELTNVLLPLAVVAPVISRMPDPEAEDPEDRERQPNRIYPDDVDIFDRVAIMERLLKGVKSLDRFRDAGAAVTGVGDVKGAQGTAL